MTLGGMRKTEGGDTALDGLFAQPFDLILPKQQLGGDLLYRFSPSLKEIQYRH